MRKLLIFVISILMVSLISCSNANNLDDSLGDNQDNMSDESFGGADGESGELPEGGSGTTPEGGSGTTPEGGEDEKPSNPDFDEPTVFQSGDVVYLTANAEEKAALAEYLTAIENFGAIITDGNGKSQKLEIIIGRNDEREECAEAYELLEKLERRSYFVPRYLVYSKYGKIVIAYDENKYTPLSALEFISSELIEKTVNENGYVAIPNGKIFDGSVDLIAEQKKHDDATVEDAWASVEASVSEDIYLALRELYTLYDDSLITWYANLYDPVTGMFYQTASGKATSGYLPDSESTKQALNFLVTSGMLDGLGKFQDNVPEMTGYKIVYYIKSIQDPNGYFYNPATTKATLDSSGIGRRGRELSWCTQLLAAFGSAPVYDTPNGKSGDGITADEYWESLGLGIAPPPNLVDIKNGNTVLTSSLSESSVTAVSKVILTASASGHYSDYRTFIDYLHSLNISQNPYAGLGTINSIYGEIAHNSELLKASQGCFVASSSDPEKYKMFDGMDLKEITIAYVNSLINPKTGLCGEPSSTRPNGTEFLYTNGFFKIIPVYNSWKVAYPEPILAAKALLAGTVSDEKTTGNICDVYNVWSALSGLRSNVKNYCDAASRDTVLRMFDQTMEERGAEAILCSYEKMKGYKQPDGGFASSAYGGLRIIHGCIPVGTGVKESNVDAIGKPTYGMLEPMFTLIGANKVPIYTRHHWMQYLQIMLEAEEKAEKHKVYFIEQEETLSYDGLPLSTVLWATGKSSNRTLEKGSDGDSVYKIEKFDTSEQTVINYGLTKVCDYPNYVSFETDLRVSDITSLEKLSFSMAPKGAGHNSRPLRFSLSFDSKASGAAITLTEEMWTGGTAFKTVRTTAIEPKVGDWFTVKFEYRLIDGAPESKVYINGKCVHTTNDVYSSATSHAPTNMTMSIVFMKQLCATLELDDTAFHQNP